LEVWLAPYWVRIPAGLLKARLSVRSPELLPALSSLHREVPNTMAGTIMARNIGTITTVTAITITATLAITIVGKSIITPSRSDTVNSMSTSMIGVIAEKA